MRQIGTLPKTADPKTFGDHLLTLGVTSRAIESPEGWAIWVYNEDHVATARGELEAFEKDPNDARFHAAAEAAEAVRRERDRLDREYQKNVRSVSSQWDRLNARRRPLTIALVAVCVVIYVVGHLSPDTNAWLMDRLLFFSLFDIERPDDLMHGLAAIRRGEVWRLVTPIFLHNDLLHLVFNVWGLIVLGSLIEYRRGTATLAALVLLSAVSSNVGQYVYMLNFSRILVPWVGISGVVYAMFGYVWMKGLYEPEQGMILHPSTVRVMLLWLLLGFIPILPIHMANGAHVVGMIVGILFGLARF